MRKQSILLIFIFLFAACSHHPRIHKILSAPETTVIDVRSPAEYKAGHLQQALNIPYKEIAEKIKSFVTDPESRIVVYCKKGKRAAVAKKKLEEMGYTNVINAGGYEEIKNIGR